jgi:hypothetical protein
MGDAKELVLFVPEESLQKYIDAKGWKDIKCIEKLEIRN